MVNIIAAYLSEPVMPAMGHEPSFTMAQILADERPLTDVIRSLDQVYLGAATLNVRSYSSHSIPLAWKDSSRPNADTLASRVRLAQRNNRAWHCVYEDCR